MPMHSIRPGNLWKTFCSKVSIEYLSHCMAVTEKTVRFRVHWN